MQTLPGSRRYVLGKTERDTGIYTVFYTDPETDLASFDAHLEDVQQNNDPRSQRPAARY
jgi:hypothetical protein